MASGFSGRLNSSEETFDHTCSQCRKKNQVSEAVKYCQECHKHLCISCLKHHNEYMEDHTLVEPSNAGRDVIMPTEKCRRHDQRRMELWSKKHEEVLCTMCAFMEHRSCEEVKIIPGNTDELLHTFELQETLDKLKGTRERLATLKIAQQLTEEELLNEKKKYLEMIVQEKEKIIRIVESLEKAAEEEINVSYDESKIKIKELKNKCDQLEEDTSACIKQLETAYENKPQMFVSMKKGQKLLLTATDFFCENRNEAKSGKEYKINSKIENYLSAMKSLGSFQKLKHLYKATMVTNINIKADTDLNEYDIECTCRLPDGSVLMIDYNNRKLKRLDGLTFTITDHCDLPDNPLAVCYVGQQEVAVCIGSNNKIQFVCVGTTMALTRSFKVDHFCRGICHRDGELFVSDEDYHVYVYNLSGTILRTISHTPSSGETLFSETRHLSVSGDRIYIADCDEGLVCIDGNGTELYRYRGTQVNGGNGVCTDGQDGVFLCGYESHNVVQVGADGEELGVVVTQADGLKYPESVCFDPSQQKLIVTMNSSDEIMVVSLI